MKKLTLRDKVSFFARNKCIIKEYNHFSPREKKYELLYCTVGDDFDVNQRIYIGERINNKLSLTLISKSKQKYDYYEKENEGFYFFGTEGIFYKRNKDTPLQNIFKGFIGLHINVNKNIALIFMPDKNDIIASIHDGRIISLLDGEEILMYGNSASLNYVSKCSISRIYSKLERVMTTINGQYYYYMISDSFNNPHIYFKNVEQLHNFVGGEPEIAYYNKDGYEANVLVSLEKNKVKIHERYDAIEEIGKGYYLGTKTGDIGTKRILKVIDGPEGREFKCIETVVEESKCSIVDEVYGITIIKIKEPEGVTLLAHHNGETESKTYLGAADISGFEANLFCNGNVIQLNPIVITKRVIK